MQDKTHWETISGKPHRKLPICLGALISDRHILTTKLCFGTMSESGDWQHTESIFSVFFADLIIQILQVPVDKVKVLYGLIYSYPHPVVSTNPFKVTEYNNYESISAIKPSPFDNFCIVTLRKPVNFDESSAAPLCLTKDPMKEFDEIKGKGKIVGFGYKEDFHNVFNSDADRHKMNQRQVEELTNIEIRSTSNCQFDKWDSSFPNGKSSFPLKRQVYGNDGQYMWLEM